MQFKEVIGNAEVKKAMIQAVDTNRVSHAQMILGPEGSGKLALTIAYAQFLLCDNPTKTDSCGECPHCIKIQNYVHPDVHFVFPIVSSLTNKVGSSTDRITEWTSLLKKRKYFNLNQWLESLDELGKSPNINVEESRQILKRLTLKSYGGKYKIMIIWLPELMNTQASNKILKLLEEPPEKTLFFLVCNNAEAILPTIMSRCQIVRVPALDPSIVEAFLTKDLGVSIEVANSAANLSQGNINEAIDIVQGAKHQQIFFSLFVKMMRAAYAANPIELMDVSDEIAALDKENQKNFLKYGLHIFRESILLNYLSGEMVNLRAEELAFLQKFARFINNQNITELADEFNDAHYHLERNANAKVLFSDVVIKLTKLIKKGV